MATGAICRLVPYLLINWRGKKAFPLLANEIHKINYFRVGPTLSIKIDFLSTRKYLR